jgi:formylglycine-generating enzyme required for sulfatase activity
VSGLGYILNWSSQRSSREAQVAKAKLPELSDIKGGAFTTINYPVGKVDTFQLAKTPVTVEQFRAFVQATGYKAGQAWDRKGKDTHPVTAVSYEDAAAYAAWLSRITGDTWYIPSEAEYEFAASNRGQKIAYPWGNDLPSPQIPMANSGRIATPQDPAPTLEVGTFPANDLGLKDMIGNVWTWTSTRTTDGLYKVKGGSWEQTPGSIKITNFARKPANLRDEKYGFRVAKR